MVAVAVCSEHGCGSFKASSVEKVPGQTCVGTKSGTHEQQHMLIAGCNDSMRHVDEAHYLQQHPSKDVQSSRMIDTERSMVG